MLLGKYAHQCVVPLRPSYVNPGTMEQVLPVGKHHQLWHSNVLRAGSHGLNPFSLNCPSHVAVNVGNLSRPTADRPALLKHSEVLLFKPRCIFKMILLTEPQSNPPLSFFLVYGSFLRQTRFSMSLDTSAMQCRARLATRSSTSHGPSSLTQPPWPWTFWRSPASCSRTGCGSPLFLSASASTSF